MPGIYKNISALTGKTPTVMLEKISSGLPGMIAAKLESFNPLGSVKDRIGSAMIEAGEREGKIGKQTVIVEPTSGNTGIALAFVCASRGYRLILTMPETMSIERRRILKALGAELILTPGREGMKGAVIRAETEAAGMKSSFMPQQFKNPANPDAHRKTTAVEIWDDTRGRVDILVCGVGTGGTITGVSESLKKIKPGFRSIAVEPEESPVLSGGSAGTHKIQGIGAGFVPEILKIDVIDEIAKVSGDEAVEGTKRLAREEGIFAGISSGAALQVAVRTASDESSRGKLIVVILPDLGDRYLSSSHFD